MAIPAGSSPSIQPTTSTDAPPGVPVSYPTISRPRTERPSTCLETHPQAGQVAAPSAASAATAATADRVNGAAPVSSVRR